MSVEDTTQLAGKTNPQVLYISPQEKSLSKDVRIIDVSQKKQQLSPETQCISNIFQNCIKQIEMAAALPAICHSDNVSGAVDQELIPALQAYKTLGERLQKLQDAEQEPHGSQEDVGETKSTARDQLEREFKNSVRDLLRLFRTRPDLSSRTEFSTEAGESECILINGLQTFHGYMIETLQKRPYEEFHLIFSKKTSSSHAHEYEHMVKLEEVAANIKQIDEKILEKNKEISIWKRRIQEEDAKHASLKRLADKRCQLHIKTSEVKQSNKQQDIDQLKIQLNNLMHENHETTRMLQEKNKKVQRETAALLQGFDSKMEEKQADLDVIKIESERDKEELRKLEKRYAVLEAKCNKIQERRRLAEERRKEEMRELDLKTKAAIVIQAWWRGHRTCKTSKGKAKGKKDKKGKGKGKK